VEGGLGGPCPNSCCLASEVIPLGSIAASKRALKNCSAANSLLMSPKMSLLLLVLESIFTAESWGMSSTTVGFPALWQGNHCLKALKVILATPGKLMFRNE